MGSRDSLPLTIRFGVMTPSKLMIMELLSKIQTIQITQIKSMSTMNWENRFLTMRGVVITAVSLPMDKLVLAKAILWLDMERTWESFPWLAMKSLGE